MAFYCPFKFTSVLLLNNLILAKQHTYFMGRRAKSEVGGLLILIARAWLLFAAIPTPQKGWGYRHPCIVLLARQGS